MKSVIILGATGSIGLNTLDVIKSHPEQYKVKALIANQSVDTLVKSALETNPEYVGLMDESKFQQLKSQLSATNIKVVAGEKAILELCKEQHDITMSAIVGAAGLKPTYTCLQHSKRLALANKEALVVAGELINKVCQDRKVDILPVDSEHSAIFQVFEKSNAHQVKKIILTASGGPFLNKPLEEMQAVTPEQAVAHPNWKMGHKISVDSATLLNKGLEYIEACMLFPIKPQQIEIVVHPESIIHSLVSYNDGSTLAQLSIPDMRSPIVYALSYPKRLSIAHNELDLAQISKLTFLKPDYKKFPLLGLAQKVMLETQAARVILNTANEVAVNAFLAKKIKFLQIYEVVAQALDSIPFETLDSLESILEYLQFVETNVNALIKNIPNS
jgi:1-deoxy-D-xylulose-5-phosphate reductoisomerase